jgi:hypothetical protein
LQVTRLALALLTVLWIGCGGKPVAVIPFRAGDTWTMTNDSGAHTNFEVLAGPAEAACERGEILILHISKDTPDTYWAVTFPQAEVWVYLLRNHDGSWRSILEQAAFPAPNRFGSLGPYPQVSRDIHAGANTYILVPGLTQSGKIVTSYRSVSQPGFTVGCLSAAVMPETSWTSNFYWEQVSTPAYTGTALVNDQLEGGTVHEKWYFAPGLGLVEIESLTSTPPVTIRRIPGH